MGPTGGPTRPEECNLEGDIDPSPGTRPDPVAGTFVLDRWKWGLSPRPRVIWVNLIVLVLLATWAGLMWVTPYTVEEGTLRDLDGFVGYRDHNETFEDLNPAARFMYRAGDSQCHQKDSRTIILNGNEMPFCARDIAIYTFLALGVALTVFPRMPYYDRVTDLKWQWLIIALVPIGVDGLGQLAGYWESTNLLRVLTGGLCGVVTGIALGFMLREVGHSVQESRMERRAFRAGPPVDPNLGPMGGGDVGVAGPAVGPVEDEAKRDG